MSRCQCLQGCSRPLAKDAGFTLIEIIVALMIFSVLSILGYQGLTAIVDYNERSRTAYEAQNQLHRASAILMQDLLHLRARPVRDRLGSVKAAYYTGDPDYAVEFTRGGLPSVWGSSSGGMQRVAYSVSEDNELLRWTWPILDSFTDDEPDQQTLMEGVSRMRFYQLNARNEFEENWPPLNESLAPSVLPRMIRIEIEFENGQSLERLVPGVEPLPQSASRGNGNNNAGEGGADEDEPDADS